MGDCISTNARTAATGSAPYLAGKNWRRTTKEESLGRAKGIAEAWYLELRAARREEGNSSRGRPSRKRPISFCRSTKSSPKASATKGGSIPKWGLRVHLLPFSANSPSQKSLRARCRNIACTDGRPPLKERANRLPAPRCMC
jgi:hypothetical protein